MKKLLELKNLIVKVGDVRVLHGINMTINEGELVVIVGKNGSGKSSLAMSLLGSSQYQIESGEMRLMGEDVKEMRVDERARRGLLVVWQSSVVVPGVSVFALSKSAVEQQGMNISSLVEFKANLEKMLTEVGLPKSYLEKSLNQEMSGGEKKRLELFFIKLLKPKLVVMDEIDSGLDVEGRELVIKIANELRERGVGIVVITHYDEFEKRLKPNSSWRMKDGRLQPRVTPTN